LFGIPLSTIAQEGNTIFQMETLYIDVHCLHNVTNHGPYAVSDHNAYFIPVNSFENSNSSEEVKLINGTFFSVTPNSTASPFGGSHTFSLAINQLYDKSSGVVIAYINDTQPYDPATLLFQSAAGDISAFCPFKTVYVNSMVKCVGWSCAITAV
jgi:hypothetical protein